MDMFSIIQNNGVDTTYFSSNIAVFIDFSKNHYKLGLKHKQTLNMFSDRVDLVVDWTTRKTANCAITLILLYFKVVVSFIEYCLKWRFFAFWTHNYEANLKHWNDFDTFNYCVYYVYAIFHNYLIMFITFIILLMTKMAFKQQFHVNGPRSIHWIFLIRKKTLCCIRHKNQHRSIIYKLYEHVFQLSKQWRWHSHFSSNLAVFIDLSKNLYKLSLKHKQTFKMFLYRDFSVVDYAVKKSDIYAITSVLLNVKVVVSFFGT